MQKREKIFSLRKELGKNLKENGFSKEFVDIKLRFKKPISQYTTAELKEVTLKSLIKYYRRKIEQVTSYKELEEIIGGIPFSRQSIEISKIEENGYSSAIHLLTDINPNLKERRNDYKERFTIENFKELLPINIKLKKFSNDKQKFLEKTGIAFAKIPIRKSSYMRSYRLRTDYKPYRLIDLGMLLAEVFLENSLELFIISNPELYEYQGIKFCFKNKIESVNSVDVYVNMKIDNINAEGICIFDKLKKFNYVCENAELNIIPVVEDTRSFYKLNLNSEYKVIRNFNNLHYKIMLSEFIDRQENIKKHVRIRGDKATEYARFFETKKHINKSTIRVMENNCFKENFGYVELDNDVDLMKFKKIEREFLQFKKAVPLSGLNDHSFRVKKLGRLKADGVYVSAPIKALIIDIGAPNSFAHECMHLIDFTTMKGSTLLSEGIRFRPIIDRYKALVSEKVDSLMNEDPFKVQWFSNKKYNKDYYLDYSEIFARAGEMYLFYIAKLETSFLYANYNSIVFPKDKEFMKMISDYFNWLFQKLKAQLPKKERSIMGILGDRGACVNAIGVAPMEYVINSDGQLRLF
ncbi:hypothetical protein V7183_22745 [Bacillus sp. JJ1127]|uniref:hypothetical protein n=1 Tax=Bacillus sp. JJ1127 TaxID=3122952 RepID=UPI002FFF4DFA